MRWTEIRAEFYPGFDPGGFITTGGNQIDEAGTRCVLLGYRAEGVVVVVPQGIDPQDEVGADIAVVVETAHLGLLRMREAGTTTWHAVTDTWATSWKRANVQVPIHVELEVTVPSGAGVKPVDLMPRIVWQLPGTLAALAA